MPAMLDDPTSPPIPLTHAIPEFAPIHVTLRDGTTKATILPFTSPSQVPPSLVSFLCTQLALEIEAGDTYPMLSPMPLAAFGPYWFSTFAAVMLLGESLSVEDVAGMQDADWSQLCLGSFYIKPNYPGRSSHVCNAGFLVTKVRRNAGVGKLLAKAYLGWAPKLVSAMTELKILWVLMNKQGFTYSVFNLVYETNVASCKIWDSLGFERIGRVKKCGQLKSFPGRKVDAIIYGYDFEPEQESASVSN